MTRNRNDVFARASPWVAASAKCLNLGNQGEVDILKCTGIEGKLRCQDQGIEPSAPARASHKHALISDKYTYLAMCWTFGQQLASEIQCLSMPSSAQVREESLHLAMYTNREEAPKQKPKAQAWVQLTGAESKLPWDGRGASCCKGQWLEHSSIRNSSTHPAIISPQEEAILRERVPKRVERKARACIYQNPNLSNQVNDWYESISCVYNGLREAGPVRAERSRPSDGPHVRSKDCHVRAARG